MARKRKQEEQVQVELFDRVTPARYTEIADDLDSVMEYMRERNAEAEEVCPVCMSVLDMLEHIRFGLDTPAIKTRKAYAVLDPDSEYLDDAVVYFEQPADEED